MERPGIETAGSPRLVVVTEHIAPGKSDREIQSRAAELGVAVSAVSAYYADETTDRGLLLGFSAVPIDAMPEAVNRLMRALDL